MQALVPPEEIPEEWNLTLLHKTVLKLNCLDLEALLKASSHQVIDERDTKGRTALWWAAYRNDVPALSLLLDHGADVNIPSQAGFSPFTTALSSSEGCARLLLEAGAKTNTRTNSGWNPIHAGCYHGASIHILASILSHGVDIDLGTSKCNTTALKLAVQEGHLQICEFLIAREASLDKPDNDGECCLHIAVIGNRPEILHLLLASKADHRVRTKAGESLLHMAAQHADLECLKVLRQFELYGINPGDRVSAISPSQTSNNVVGSTALQIAERRPNVTPEWLDAFHDLVRHVASSSQSGDRESTPVCEMEEDLVEFEDAVEYQNEHMP